VGEKEILQRLGLSEYNNPAKRSISIPELKFCVVCGKKLRGKHDERIGACSVCREVDEP
jgi:putative hemolysin